jgi:hypothetical protein
MLPRLVSMTHRLKLASTNLNGAAASTHWNCSLNFGELICAAKTKFGWKNSFAPLMKTPSLDWLKALSA